MQLAKVATVCFYRNQLCFLGTTPFRPNACKTKLFILTLVFSDMNRVGLAAGKRFQKKIRLRSVLTRWLHEFLFAVLSAFHELILNVRPFPFCFLFLSIKLFHKFNITLKLLGWIKTLIHVGMYCCICLKR